MKTLIFYFSGTGNSLFIAKRLKENLENSELMPIVKFLSKKNREIESCTLILVFPVHALTIPLPVRSFLKKMNFKKVKYFACVATRLGTYFNDFKRIERYTYPKKVDSQFIINMGDNDIKKKNYRKPSKDKLKELEDIALKELSQAIEIIQNKKIYKPKDIHFLEPLPYGDYRDKIAWWFIPKLMTFSKIIGGVNYFYTNSKCNNCGICSIICTSGKISMKDKIPVWDKNILCYMCYACVNFCPKEAIDIKSIIWVKSYSHENERYSHPYTKVSDIQNQKCNCK